MVDDVKNIAETAESKAAAEALDRAKLSRERREAEQRRKLEELRAHAAAAQAQRERREEERRRRQADQRASNDDRRHLVEERKRSIWEASVSRREALLQREREREERLERTRAARSAPRPAFAFGSSTPRLLEPVDTAGFFWAARSTNPIDQMNFFESLAASTTNVMFASAPLTRRASALHLDADNDTKDEPDRTPQPAMWSSVARRRTDLVPTMPAPRGPGRAYSMTRLDRLPPQRPLHSASPSLHQLTRQGASGASTPGSRPGSALSNGPAAAVLRRATPRRPRPASIAGTGVNTPRGGGDAGPQTASLATTPSVSRDASSTNMAGGDAARRPPASTPRRPRPVSLIATRPASASTTPGDGKPPLHRKPKLSKEQEKANRGKSLSVSPRRGTSPSPAASKEPSVDKEIANKKQPKPAADKSQVSATEVLQKLEALQIHGGDLDDKVNEHKEQVALKPESKEEDLANVVEQAKPEPLADVQRPAEKPRVADKRELPENKTEVLERKTEVPENKTDVAEKKPEVAEKKPVVAEKKPVVAEKKPEVPDKKPEVVEKVEKVEKREDKRESAERPEESEMTASMTARRITTEGEAKAALAERRRKAREELEKQAELERQRLQREAEEEAERQRQDEERQRREEEEARELAQLQRRMEEEKLRKAIEAQQQLAREEAERRAREEADKLARLKEEEEKRRALEEELRLKREEAEREEQERLARKQRVEAIMARTRLKKAEEDKKQSENKASSEPQPAPTQAPSSEGTPVHSHNNGNAKTEPNNGNATADLLGLSAPSLTAEPKSVPDVAAGAVPAGAGAGSIPAPNNGNVAADLLGLSEQTTNEDKLEEQPTSNNKAPQPIDNAPTPNPPTLETNNGNVPHPAPASVGHISANFIQTERMSSEQQKLAENVSKFDDDFTTHNGHGHPLTLQNAI